MKVKVIQNVFINNKHRLGDVFTVEKAEGERLIKLGVTSEVKETPKEEEKPKTATRKRAPKADKAK